MESQQKFSAGLEKSVKPGSGDWFVYDGAKVSGPHGAEALMRFQGETGKSYLISRVGFARWYKMDELAGIMEVTEKLTKKTEREKQRLNKTVDQRLNHLGQLASEDPQDASTGIKRSMESILAEHTLERSKKRPRKLKKRELRNRQLRTTESEAAQVPLKQPVYTEQQHEPWQDPAERKAKADPAKARHRKKAHEQKAVAAEKSVSVRNQAYDQEHEYYRLRGRLRLGPMRSQWLFSLLLWPLSLGFVSFWWYRDLATELGYHVFNDYKSRLPHAVWTVVPGVHLHAYFALASLMAAAEEQNHYRHTSPNKVMWLSLVPPLAIWYLQKAANRHWRLHVEHASRRTSKTEAS